MHRAIANLRRRLARTAAAGALLVPATLAAQTPYDTIEVRVERLAEGVHVLFGAGGNVAVASGPEATFVVDDQYAPMTPKLRAAIARLTPRPATFVLNTHWHFDHTGGNEQFGEAGALLVAHRNVRRRMEAGQFIDYLKREVPPAVPAALPVVTFTDTVTFHVNGEAVTVLHVPNAHTDGDAMVVFPRANVVHAGDVFVRYGYPFIDRSSGGSLVGAIAAMERLVATVNDSTRIIPGHGAVATRDDARAYLAMLVTVRDRIRTAQRRGLTLDRFLAASPTQDLDPTWGRGTFVPPRAFLEGCWAELAAAPDR